MGFLCFFTFFKYFVISNFTVFYHSFVCDFGQARCFVRVFVTLLRFDFAGNSWEGQKCVKSIRKKYSLV